ncbi:hypothetical protein JHK82_054786 [Glycine max]|nr:hypothetical protein JHK82_054786 [Glycine max]
MFMATDDLVVERMSPSSGVSLLNRLKTSLNDVKEKFVTIGIKEKWWSKSLNSVKKMTVNVTIYDLQFPIG